MYMHLEYKLHATQALAQHICITIFVCMCILVRHKAPWNGKVYENQAGGANVYIKSQNQNTKSFPFDFDRTNSHSI